MSVIVATRHVATNHGDVLINFGSRTIWRNGRLYIRDPMTNCGHGTPAFTGIAMLMCASPRLITKTELMDLIYGDLESGGPEWDSWAATLSYKRSKINDLGFRVITEWGRGYRFEPLRSMQVAA